MSYDVTATFSKEQAILEGTYPIEMVVVNASLSGFDPIYFANINQDIYGYALDSSGEFTPDSSIYLGLPLTIQNFSTSTEGKLPEVSVSIPNTDRSVEAIIQDQDYLRSREVYLITTYAKFLPTGTDYRHIGTSPDRNAAIKEKLYISSVTTNQEAATFNCKPKFDLKNAKLPRRRYSKECSWIYGDVNCDPDEDIDYVTYPTCNYTLENCEKRGNSERYGGFPSIPRKALVIL
jgi:lambda family phage minor tail protein L